MFCRAYVAQKPISHKLSAALQVCVVYLRREMTAVTNMNPEADIAAGSKAVLCDVGL
jgi:hypothetical protein